jgi:hypothetical protein
MVEFSKEEIEKERDKVLRNLQKKEIRQTVKKEYKASKNPELSRENEKLSRYKSQEALKNIKRQNLKNSATYRTIRKVSNVTSRFEGESGKSVGARARVVRRLASAVGATGKGHAGPGRPRGTYKYGAPIQQIQKLQSQRKAVAQLQAQKLQFELTRKGYTPEQIQQIMAQQQFEASPEQYEQAVAEANVSPNTMLILEQIRAVQNKGKADDANMQRILRERKMVNQQMNLMNTPNIFKAIPGQMEGWLERPETNPLRAHNIFAEDRTRNPSILDTQGRPTILNAVQKLNFFEDPLRQNRPGEVKKPIQSTKLNFWKS